MTNIAQLNEINEAIRKLQQGERVVQVAHEGHVVKYAEVDLEQLLQLRDRIRATGHGKRRIQIISDKGVH